MTKEIKAVGHKKTIINLKTLGYIEGIKFNDGVEVTNDTENRAA